MLSPAGELWSRCLRTPAHRPAPRAVGTAPRTRQPSRSGQSPRVGFHSPPHPCPRLCRAKGAHITITRWSPHHPDPRGSCLTFKIPPWSSIDCRPSLVMCVSAWMSPAPPPASTQCQSHGRLHRPFCMSRRVLTLHSPRASVGRTESGCWWARV